VATKGTGTPKSPARARANRPRATTAAPLEESGAGDQDRIAFQGRRTTVRIHRVTHPNGHVTDYEIVERPDAVAVVALRAGAEGEPEVALVSQRRPAVGQDLLEIPAGIVEPEEREAPERAAARELREETGYDAGDLRPLAAEYPSPGYTTEIIHLYLASALRAAPGGQQLDPGEQIRLSWLPLDAAIARCRSGALADGKTLLSLLLARDELAGGAVIL
jgi:ADP-ribose pyrophosphatase